MDSTTICNLALSKIGDQMIMSLDDPSIEARFCKLHYAPTLASLLRMHDWNWAVGMTQLAQLSTPPPFDWDYSYQLPSDFARILTLNAFQANEPYCNFDIIGDKLLTDESTAYITYVKSAVDPNLFDPMFVELLSLAIAAKLAKPLGGSMDIKQRLEQDFKQMLGEARRIDAQDSYPRRKPMWLNSDLVQSRYNGIY
jgi:hypothetical protein